MADNNTGTPNAATAPAAATPTDTTQKAAPATGAEPVKAAEAVAQKVEAAKAAEIRRLKLKMDGQDVDLPEEEVIKMAQMAGSAQKRWESAAALKKQTEQVLEFLQSQPAAALKKLVADPAAYRKLLEDELTEIVKRDAESPEAKKIREQEERLRSYEAKEREAAEAAEKQKQADAQSEKERKHAEDMDKWRKEYDALFTEALAKVDLPKNAYTVRRMAELQKINMRKGFNLDASSLVKLVREDYEAELKHWIGDRDGDQLMALFGDDVVKKLSKAQIKKLKAANVQKFSTPVQETRDEKPKQTGSWRELMKRNRMTG